MSKRYTRRQMLGRTGQALAIAAFYPPLHLRAQITRGASSEAGVVIGEEAGAKVGLRVLSEGGNAVDAAVAAALTSCVVTPSRCGIGGYGGHMTIALAGGKKVSSIDFNSAAPAAARPDMYPLDEHGQVKDHANFFGWRAVGVPGTLAGLKLALDRFGTRSFADLVQPAITFAREGFVVNGPLANTIRTASARFRADPGSASLYLKDGELPRVGEIMRNPELGELLTTLAARNSVESFYRGDIAQRLAECFEKNHGLVTAKDLAAYHARQVEPLQFKWKDFALFTAPLTAGGLTVVEALSILKALKWDTMPASGSSAHARLEALRLAWKDRLELLGDPAQVKVPVKRLVSSTYASELARRIQSAVKSRQPLDIKIEARPEEGTNNLSSVDRHGNMVAMTLTQGGSFGAQVTAEGLGLTLGHGMSRFDPRPGHPNAPGPGKRPLHNMCPSVVLRDGKPVLALGGAGGTRIPNAVFDVLTCFMAGHATMEEAVTAPRLHSTGSLEVGVEQHWPKDAVAYLEQLGFKFRTLESARISAVSYAPRTGRCQGAMR